MVEVGDEEAMLGAGFVASDPTVFIVHGFIDTGFETWVKVGQPVT